MKTYTKDELAAIIESHGKWLRNEDGGERADLRGSDLRGSNLSGSDLRGSDLRGSDLSGSDLRGSNGNANQLKTIHLETYPIAFTSEHLQIGCERHLIADWWEFDDARIAKMDGKKASLFWDKWKVILRQIIEMSPATPTGNKSKQEAA